MGYRCGYFFFQIENKKMVSASWHARHRGRWATNGRVSRNCARHRFVTWAGHQWATGGGPARGWSPRGRVVNSAYTQHIHCLRSSSLYNSNVANVYYSLNNKVGKKKNNAQRRRKAPEAFKQKSIEERDIVLVVVVLDRYATHARSRVHGRSQLSSIFGTHRAPPFKDFLFLVVNLFFFCFNYISKSLY